MRSSTTPAHNSQPYTHPYSPAVPISVYRELVAELQATQAMLDSLSAQNQQLAKQNQQLRQEIEKVVQCALQTQQVVNSTKENRVNAYHPYQVLKSKSSRPVSSPSMHYRSQRAGGAGLGSVRNTFFEAEEIEVDRYRHHSPLESTSEMSGWRLAIAIVLVVVTAFSGGYLLVRPLISNR